MLVLSRKRGEWFRIYLDNGEEINICILEIRDSRGVRIGIDAPPRLRILRAEHVEENERRKKGSVG
jgi:carbon storage regulator CsrA